MPIVHVLVGAPADPALAGRIAHEIQSLTVSVLRKPPDLTAIALQFVDPDHWFIAGRALSDWGQCSVHVDIKVTDETNTKDEKARYIAELFDALGRVLGPLHEESYLHVHDVRGAAYGYGGRTQEWRYQHPATGLL